MAATLPCDMCGEEPAAVMVTNLGNGEVLCVGGACQLTFHLTVAAELIKNGEPGTVQAYDEQVGSLLDTFNLALAEWAGTTAAAAAAGPAAADEPDEPEPEPYDPGPEVDDQGGMSEHKYLTEPADEQG